MTIVGERRPNNSLPVRGENLDGKSLHIWRSVIRKVNDAGHCPFALAINGEPGQRECRPEDQRLLEVRGGLRRDVVRVPGEPDAAGSVRPGAVMLIDSPAA